MGQMTYALMYGVPFPEKAPEGHTWTGTVDETTNKWVRGILQQKPPRSCAEVTYDHDGKVLGVLLEPLTPIPIHEIETDERYARLLSIAKTTWAWFAAVLDTLGMKLPEPRVWLVETETR